MSKRRTRKTRKTDDKVEVPMSSMIDVVFLLLIYFIVTQKPIIEDTLLDVNLPSPDTKSSSQNPVPPLTIDVMDLKGYENADKIYHVNGEPWALSTIRTQMKSYDKDKTLVIRCGPNATHGKLIKILDLCSEAKLTNLNIINDDSVKFVPYQQ